MAGGRPKIEIDRKQFENLCNIQCTLEEIAGWFRCSDSTIKRWCHDTYGESFERVYKKYSKDGKISLRRYQFQLAKKSATMAIWLGKQMLGQTDKAADVEMTDLQKEKLRTDIESAKRTYGGAEYEDDGFTEAVKRSARGVWDDGGD